LGFLVGCSKPGKPQPPVITNPALIDRLEAKYNTYLDLYQDQQDSHGFILSDACDSLLFTGLLGAVLPEGIDIHAAEKTPGEWTRRPLVDGKDTCYPDNSKSSISRDMLLGLQWYAWGNKNLRILKNLWDYGTEHTWVMGKGAPSRILFTPNAQALLAEGIYRLGGTDHFIARAIPVVRGKNEGFQAHLDYLSILLRAEYEGKMDADSLSLMGHHLNRQPRNSLVSYIYHRYTDGVYDQAVNTLLDSQLFPEDRLPTSADRKTPWLWERDDGPNWKPRIGGDVHSHPGGDFLFMAHLILRDLGRL